MADAPKFGLITGSLLFFLNSSSQMLHATGYDCVPLSIERAPTWNWAEQDSYRVIPLDTEGKRYRIIGDILNITEEKFKSIVANPNSPNTKIEELIFDARLININASLPFESARLLFLAEEIVFGPKAVITFTSRPRQDNAGETELDLPKRDGVAFAAKRIKLDHPKRQFLYFNTAKNLGHQVTVLAEQLLWADTQVEGDKSSRPSAANAIRSATLDDFLGIRREERSYTETLGRSATPKLALIAHEMMLWPQFFATKLIVSHARGAYDSNWASALKEQIAQERETIENWGNAAAIAAINRTEDLLERGLDPYGRSASYAPIEDLKSIRDTLATVRADLESSKGYVQSLEQTIIDSLKERGVDQERLSTIRSAISTQSSKIEDARFKQIAANNAVTLATQKYESTLSTVKQHRDSIQREVERQVAERRAGAENLGRANSIALAASLIPGGSWLGISAQAWGRINSGQFSDGKFTLAVLLKTFEEIDAQQKEFNAAAETVRKEWEKTDNIYVARQRVASGDRDGAWKALHGNGSPPADWKLPTQKALLTEFAKSLHGVIDAASKLTQKVPAPHVLEIKVSEAEAQDEGFRRVLAQAEEANDDLTRAYDEAKSATEDYINATSSLTSLEESERNVLGRKPTNDLEKSTTASLAEDLLRQRYQDIDQQAIDLKRAAIYANGQPINLDHRLSYFFEEAIGQQLSFTGRAELVAHSLSETRLKTSEALGIFLEAADRERKEYSRRLRDDGFSELGPFTFRAEAINSAGAYLISQLNENIAQQIVARAKPLLFPIPIAWQQVNDQHPRRFVDAVITGVKLRNGVSLRGKSLNFRVVHPGYGTISLGSSCRIVDTRLAGRDLADSRITAFAEGHPSETYDRVSAQFQLKAREDNFKYAALPLRTQYQIEVRVMGDATASDWSEVPALGEISVSFATIQ